MEECRKMHSSLFYKDENGRKYKLRKNAVNNIRYSSIGAIYSDNLNAYCSGVEALEHGELLNDLVVMNSVEITLKSKIQMKFTDGLIKSD